MGAIETEAGRKCDLHAPRRNRYFYGKLLDAYHFELETGYFNAKRSLLNRLVTGYGVVCGLDVDHGDEPGYIVIKPGLAIDKQGREIVVEHQTQPIRVPVTLPPPDDPEQKYPGGEGHECHVLLCYHECLTEPVHVLASECQEQEPCQPGVIQERYKLIFRNGCLPPASADLTIPDVIQGEGRYEMDYATLVKWVSRQCPPCSGDPCIPLANLYIGDASAHPCQPDIDITVRPIVYTNDLLFQLLLSLIKEPSGFRSGK